MPKIYPLGHNLPDGYSQFIKLVINKTTQRSHTLFFYSPYDQGEEGEKGTGLMEMVGLPDPVATIQDGDSFSLGLIAREPFKWIEEYRWSEVEHHPEKRHIYALFMAWNDARIWRRSVKTKLGAALSEMMHGPANIPDTSNKMLVNGKQVVYDLGNERRADNQTVSIRAIMERALTYMVGKKFRVLPIGKDDGETVRKSILFPSYCTFKEDDEDNGGRFLEAMALQGYVEPSILDQFHIDSKYAEDEIIAVLAKRENTLISVLTEAVKEAKTKSKGDK